MNQLSSPIYAAPPQETPSQQRRYQWRPATAADIPTIHYATSMTHFADPEHIIVFYSRLAHASDPNVGGGLFYKLVDTEMERVLSTLSEEERRSAMEKTLISPEATANASEDADDGSDGAILASLNRDLILAASQAHAAPSPVLRPTVRRVSAMIRKGRNNYCDDGKDLLNFAPSRDDASPPLCALGNKAFFTCEHHHSTSPAAADGLHHACCQRIGEINALIYRFANEVEADGSGADDGDDHSLFDPTIVGYTIAHPWHPYSVVPLEHVFDKDSLPRLSSPSMTDASPLPSSSAMPWLYLHDCGILPYAHNSGGGKALVEELLVPMAKALGMSVIALTSVNSSSGYWGRRGFVSISDGVGVGGGEGFEPLPEAVKDKLLKVYGPDAKFMVKRIEPA